MEALKLFFFGDSICFGQGVSIHKTWVSRISQKLDEMFPNNVIAQNPSINGNTTRMALERMPFDVQSHSPDIVFVQFGLNDGNYWETDNGMPRVSLNSFKANLNEIIDRCYASGAKGVMLGTNHPTTRTVNNFPYTNFTFENSNQKYNQAIREVSNSRSDILLLDAEEAFKKILSANNSMQLRDLLLTDQLHLSESGHEVYYSSRIEHFCSIVSNFINKNN